MTQLNGFILQLLFKHVNVKTLQKVGTNIIYAMNSSSKLEIQRCNLNQ